MRAVAVPRFRAPAELMELPDPAPGSGEVGVRIEAAGMNPFDWKIADGGLDGHRPHVFPLVLGVDGSGTVEAVGTGVTDFRVGERVAGSFLHDPVGIGTYAERTVAPQSNCLVPIPSTLDARLAAALPTAGMTAVQSLDRLRAAPGGTIAIVGASGGIGSYAVQLARLRGLSVVAVARPASHARLRTLGAGEVVDVASPESLPADRRFDGLLDVVSSSETFAGWARHVRAGGVAVSTIGSARPVPEVETVSISMEPARRDLAYLVSAVERGSLTVPLERTISLAEAVPALEDSRAGRTSGKTVVVP